MGLSVQRLRQEHRRGPVQCAHMRTENRFYPVKFVELPGRVPVATLKCKVISLVLAVATAHRQKELEKVGQ